jgi:hypothetical protein
VLPQQSRRVGRPPCCPPETARRIRELNEQGYSLRQIAQLLNDDAVPTPLGRARWGKSHVYRVLGTQYVRELGAESITKPPVRA